MKRTVRAVPWLTAALLLGAAFLGGCGAGNASSGSQGATHKSPGSTRQASGATSSTNQKPAPKEQHPVGDIPDTQAFVTYKSPQGNYKLEVPEGWARTVKGRSVSFVNKLDGLSVTLKNTSAAPTAASVRKDYLPALKKAEGAVRVSGVQSVGLPSGRAVLVEYTSNSRPDPVTGKRVRLENNSYFYFRNGKIADLRLYAPLGADNVDQWRRISESFRWT